MPRKTPTTTARPRRAGADATRERILAAAIELFAERGFAATGIEALCQRANVVRTAIYWHFDSKEGLLVPVIERVASEWIEEIQKSVYLEGDPLARLDRFVASLRDLVVLRPNLVRLLLSVALERSDHDAATREALRAIFERARAAIVQGIDDSLGAPYAESALIARTALAFVSHAVAHRLVDPRPGEVERIFAELRTAIVLMIGARVQELVAAAPNSKGSPS
jgi:TetR/AcrR family fatty acid metabolism transcriptional regulator